MAFRSRPAAAPSEPFLEPAVRRVDGAVTGVLILAHGGKEHSREAVNSRNNPLRRMRMIGSAVAPKLAKDGVVVHVLRFRVRGWNGDARDPVPDVRWAVERVRERYGDVPVVLTGHSLGGRAVVNAADAPGVVAVLGLAPWLPADEPVEQLAGRRVLLAHGTRDKVTSPRSSYEYGVRARAAGHQVARIELPGSGHTLLSRAKDWNRLVLSFAHGALVGAGDDQAAVTPRHSALIAAAFADAGDTGLRRELAPAGRDRG